MVIPKNEPNGNPVCIVFTDPLEGVEPGGQVNKWVSFAGYAFKLLRYESVEKDKDDSSKNKWRRAPLCWVAPPSPDRTRMGCRPSRGGTSRRWRPVWYLFYSGRH